MYGMEGVGTFSVKQGEGKVTYFAFGQEVGREVAVMEKRAGEGKEGEADPVPKGGWREVSSNMCGEGGRQTGRQTDRQTDRQS